MNKRVAVVIGSNRPGRICPSIAGWLQKTLQDSIESSTSEIPVHYEVLDLAEQELPFLDEPLIPAFGNYQRQHTKEWSQTISGYDGFVFVFPQYNWGYPAVLKNALDFLYEEWSGKPATYATYGTRGGHRAGVQFQSVLAGLHMRRIYGHLEFALGRDHVDADWQLKDPGASLAPYTKQVQRMGEQMHQALGVHTADGRRPLRSIQAALIAAQRFGILLGVLPPARLRQRPKRNLGHK